MTRRLKRLLDVVVAATALVVLSPIILGVALAVLVWEGRPILFRQLRPGLHGVPFEMVKFRTMRNDLFDEDGNLASSDRRTTRVGYLLRKTSVDELPELVERAARRDEHRRTAAAADGVPVALLARAGPAPRGPAGDHRPGPGPGSRDARVGEALRARCVVRRPLVAPP